MSHDIKIAWTSWPFVENPSKSIFVCAILFLISVLLFKIAVLQWSMPIFHIGGMLLLIMSLLPYFILTEYNMYEDKIVIKYLFLRVERKYSDFGCFYSDGRGVMLSTFKLPRSLDSYRGQSLRFSKDKHEAELVLELLSKKITRKY